MPLLASEAVEPNVYFTAADFDAQSVWANIEWQTLFPIDPVFPHHLMLVCQRRRAVKYSDLTDGEAISLRDAVAHLDTRYRRHFSAAYIGYNLFSNNGDSAHRSTHAALPPARVSPNHRRTRVPIRTHGPRTSLGPDGLADLAGSVRMVAADSGLGAAELRTRQHRSLTRRSVGQFAGDVEMASVVGFPLQDVEEPAHQLGRFPGA